MENRSVLFTVPGPPQGKGRAKITMQGGFARGYTPEKTANYENYIKMRFLEINEPPFQREALFVQVISTHPIPAGTSKKKRAAMLAGEIRPLVKPDFDNIGKVVCDALNKIAWADDSHIVDGRVLKYYGEVPGVQVYIDNYSWRQMPFGED